MPDKTTNYELIQPRPEEAYDIGVQNQNMNMIDEVLKDHADELEKKANLNGGFLDSAELPVNVVPILNTQGSGSAYTATIAGLTTLKKGTLLIIVPHAVSTSTTPTLNVNNLGAKIISRQSSSTTDSGNSGYTTNWVTAGIPLLVQYDGTRWVAIGQAKPNAADLTGTTAVAHGGTGKTSWTAYKLIYPTSSTALAQLSFPTVTGSFLRQGISGAPYWSSPAEVLTAIGAAPLSHTSEEVLDSEEGVHGLRVMDRALQYWDGSEWKDVGKSYFTFGVRIDTANSNPSSAVTYIDDAVGMTGGSAAWDAKPIFKAIRPCVMKNGIVQYYLNPLNFAQKADGSAATITSETAGDVMIEIPKVGFKISTSGNYVDVEITDNPNAGASGFHYYAHTRSIEGDREKLYLGAYLGSVINEKLHSISGKYPTASHSIGEFINFAKAKGAGYDIMGFYPMTLVQCLYLIKYKSLNGQAALGRGYVGHNAKETLPTGGANTKGMCWGDQGGMNQMKVFGLEDFWGNVCQFVGGLYCDTNRHILTAFRDFNTTGAGYTDQGTGGFTENTCGWIKKVQGTTELGFILKEGGGSNTTYFSDYGWVYAEFFPYFGGHCLDNSYAGPFKLYMNSYAGSEWSVGARLMYL